jgi:hypothetical protein
VSHGGHGCIPCLLHFINATRNLGSIGVPSSHAPPVLTPAPPTMATLCSLSDVVAIAERCLAEDVESFRASIQLVVDELEEMRRSCTVRSTKALATRLLFILTRCRWGSRRLLSLLPFCCLLCLLRGVGGKLCR